MLYSMYLTKKQRGVLADLFSGQFTVQEVLGKRKVSRRTYHRWHAQECFAAEFKRLLDLTRNEYKLILARYASDIAMKLVSLTAADKDETARRACIAALANHVRKAGITDDDKNQPQDERFPEIPPDVASRLLAALANEKVICI
jgi:predicted DNA-binding protein YlxM (UPF0122 family)